MTKMERKELPMFPLYQTKKGDTFNNLRDAAASLDFVTVAKRHKLTRRPVDVAASAVYRKRSKEWQAGTHTRSTLVNEITAVPRDPLPEIQALFSRGYGKDSIQAVPLANRAIEALSTAIETGWDPMRRHVMMFSSGYDTRLIAGLLRRLHKEKGDAWLGDCRFCCFEPEVAAAKKVYDYIGFPQRMWFPVYPGSEQDYYAPCIDFAAIGANITEADRLWGGPLLVQQALEESGFLLEPAQGLTALFSDETCKWNRLQQGDVGWFMGCYFFDEPGILPGRPDVEFVMPFASLGWLELVSRYAIPVPIDDFKLTMIRQLDPDLGDLEKIPNHRFAIGPLRDKTGGYLPQQKISGKTVQKMEDDYRSSWYANTFGPAVLGYGHVFRYYDPKNEPYMKAAIYEHLRTRTDVRP